MLTRSQLAASASCYILSAMSLPQPSSSIWLSQSGPFPPGLPPVSLGHADVSAPPLSSFPPRSGSVDSSYVQANISLGWLDVDLLHLTAAEMQQLLLAVVDLYHKTQTSTQTLICPQRLTKKVCLHSASRLRLHLFHLVRLLLRRILDTSSERNMAGKIARLLHAKC